MYFFKITHYEIINFKIRALRTPIRMPVEGQHMFMLMHVQFKVHLCANPLELYRSLYLGLIILIRGIAMRN